MVYFNGFLYGVVLEEKKLMLMVMVFLTVLEY